MSPFPLGLLNPASHPGEPPGSADVVVIGGGVIGVATALFLKRRNLSVVLVEKGRVAAEQSSRNWGWIRQQGRDPAELPIMIEARRLWLELAAACGEDFGLRTGGVTYLARSARELADFEAWMVHARDHGLDSRILDGGETAALIPAMAKTYHGALTTPSDMRAEPWLAVPALARLAAREGVRIVEDCAARRLDMAAGRVAGVVTEKGRIATSQAVLCGGAWSALFLRAHSVALPQLSVLATVAATGPLPAFHEGAATDEHIAFRRRQDGGYTIAAGALHDFFIGPDAFRALPAYLPTLGKHARGTHLRPAAPRHYPDAWGTARQWEADEVTPFERMRVLAPKPSDKARRAFTRDFSALFPQFGPVRLNAIWAGMIDTLPDVVPVIDRCESVPGLTVATGLSGHGFGIGPGVGRVVADLVAGGTVGHDLSRFRLSRFSDGSPIRPGPAL